VASALTEIGHRQVDVTVPNGPSLYEIFVPYQMAEAHHVHHAILGTYPGQSADYGDDVRVRLEAASSVTIGDYLDARRLASETRATFQVLFGNVDIVIALVCPRGPSSVTQPDVVDVDGQPVPLRDAVMPSTVAQNIAGLPSVTVPAGHDAEGMPIGVQITGPPWSEPVLLNVAVALESVGACSAGVPELFTWMDCG
jgi:aspartyl-tRNA(Asn)/glutamyl-tRNA(Gln) amidotransferase subunit A